MTLTKLDLGELKENEEFWESEFLELGKQMIIPEGSLITCNSKIFGFALKSKYISLLSSFNNFKKIFTLILSCLRNWCTKNKRSKRN